MARRAATAHEPLLLTVCIREAQSGAPSRPASGGSLAQGAASPGRAAELLHVKCRALQKQQSKGGAQAVCAAQPRPWPVCSAGASWRMGMCAGDVQGVIWGRTGLDLNGRSMPPAAAPDCAARYIAGRLQGCKAGMAANLFSLVDA